MPNRQGGKKYKSSKHGEQKAEFHEVGPGQMIARVIKVLGDRNMLLYCNDSRERIAHIRGGLRKKEWIEVGDIVLMSQREMEMGDSKDRGDILAKYSHELTGQLKKIPGINPNLFTPMNRGAVEAHDDSGFEFDRDASSEDGDSQGASDGSENEEARAAKKLAEELKRGAARDVKTAAMADADDLDIDAI